MIPDEHDPDEWALGGVTALGLVFLAAGALALVTSTGVVVSTAIVAVRVMKGCRR